MKKHSFNSAYSTDKFFWGIKPNSLLVQAVKYVREGKALDIGAGEGRDAIFLAKNGLEVTAIDISQEGLNKVKQLAKQEMGQS